MKGILGSLLLGMGLGLLIAASKRESSAWFFALCYVPVVAGIELLISEKVEKAVEGLRNEFKRNR